jgi:hypothetical protein
MMYLFSGYAVGTISLFTDVFNIEGISLRLEEKGLFEVEKFKNGQFSLSLPE